MHFRKILFLISLTCSLFSEEDEAIRRIHSHLLIEDPHAAVLEAEIARVKYPDSKAVNIAYLKALSRAKKEKKALSVYREILERNKEELSNREILEELSWGVLQKGIESSQYGIRLTGLIGSYLTQDVRAVKTLLLSLRDSNAILRTVAVQLASHYGDHHLQKEISKMMRDEKSWMVRVELIRALGKMRMKEKTEYLKKILENDRSTFEEKALAIEALVNIHEDIKEDEITILAKSPRAGLRLLACQAATVLALESLQSTILPLIQDSNPDVRVGAINALTLVFHKNLSKEEIERYLFHVLHDSDPTVAIVASWSLLLSDPKKGSPYLEEWLYHENPELRRLAASALAQSGERGRELARKILKKSFDPYVRANIALGLIGQRTDVKECCNTLYNFMKMDQKWMWENHKNTLFQVLGPSKVRYNDQIPNYPEATDQMTRLQLLSILAVLEDERAHEAILEFLQKKNWGITGFAAATLLQEGDSEALDIIRSLLEHDEENVRLQAALVLALYGKDENVAVYLQNAYKSADHEHKLHILEALGRIGTEKTYPFLVEVFDEPFQILRVAAASALIQCLHH